LGGKVPNGRDKSAGIREGPRGGGGANETKIESREAREGGKFRGGAAEGGSSTGGKKRGGPPRWGGGEGTSYFRTRGGNRKRQRGTIKETTRKSNQKRPKTK